MLQPSHSPPFFDFLSQEQEKSAQVSRRVNTISEVSENVKRMDEFLESYRRGELSPADQDSLQVNALFPPCARGSIPCRGGTDRCVWGLSSAMFPQALLQRCERLRPLLFRLASEAVPDEEALGKSQHCPCAPWHWHRAVPCPGTGVLGCLAPCGQSSPLSL